MVLPECPLRYLAPSFSSLAGFSVVPWRLEYEFPPLAWVEKFLSTVNPLWDGPGGVGL